MQDKILSEKQNKNGKNTSLASSGISVFKYFLGLKLSHTNVIFILRRYVFIIKILKELNKGTNIAPQHTLNTQGALVPK